MKTLVLTLVFAFMLMSGECQHAGLQLALKLALLYISMLLPISIYNVQVEGEAGSKCKNRLEKTNKGHPLIVNMKKAQIKHSKTKKQN